MEQLLRGQKAPEIEGLRFFPVRHHSPACSYHLLREIREYEPDCILIEGPENAQDMIPVLTDNDTKAPVALYYFYKDTAGRLSEEKEDYRCYYPFLDYSPELVALREAKARNIPARFIDLPYGEILLGTAENRGIWGGGKQQTYNDDYLLSRSRYLNALCEKAGFREFDELWEACFEIDGLFVDTGEFVSRMRLWCGLTREQTSREEMEADGCLLRERYMAQNIAEAAKTYRRILVVTGGFHTAGLEELLGGKNPAGGQPSAAGGSPQFTAEPVKLHNIKGEDQGVYPLAYSMEAADALNGYASGMQSPGFYQKVWEHLWEEDGSPKRSAYEAAVLHQLVTAGRQARRKKENISSADIISALSMAKGLAALRGKREPGLYELRDGALSAFVKGECNLSTDGPLRILSQINTGRQVGTLCSGAPRPPILGDFEQQCRKYNLKIQSSLQQEVTLEIFTKQRHLGASRFFYRMDFLKTQFCQRRKGSDLLNRRDKSRVREVWSYRFSSGVLSALVDVSMAGATVEEAAQNRLSGGFSAAESCRDGARLMTQGFLMGFLDDQKAMGEKMRRLIADDGDFLSLAEGFSYLKMLYELQELYQVEAGAALEQLLELCFGKIVQLLPSMAQVGEEQAQPCMEACLSLYQMTGAKRFASYRPVLMEAFERLSQRSEIHPGLLGAVLGLLFGNDNGWEEQIQAAAAGYLQGTEEARMESAGFLRGLFYTARDFVFVKEGFLEMIDGLIERLDAEEFLRMLPQLRMAFGYFTPVEIDRIAQRAAKLHGAAKQQLTKGRLVSPKEFEYGQALDRFAKEEMEGEAT